jgi:hypothetical protein
VTAPATASVKKAPKAPAPSPHPSAQPLR